MNAKKILIIDDEVKILNIFSKQLRVLGGFEVDTAVGGKEGLEKLKSGEYGILLLDLMMMDMDGIEVLEKIKELGVDIKVIMLTNLVNDEQKARTSELGAMDYIIKTDIDPETLIEKINKLLTDDK